MVRKSEQLVEYEGFFLAELPTSNGGWSMSSFKKQLWYDLNCY